MPGKHAPESPSSFYLSVGRAAAGALVVLAVVAVIAIAATGTSKKPTATGSTPPVTTPSSHAPTATPSSSLSPTPTATSTPATKVTVNVYNGTARNGLARGFADKLSKQGYVVKTVATQTAHQAVTTIYYRPGDKAAAEALLAAHPELGRIQPATSATPTNAMLTVVLGDDYRAA